MTTQPRSLLSEDEYLAIERSADFKSEYMDGEAVAMAGASFDHNLLVANCVGALWGRLRGTPCAVVPSDLKVQASNKVYYPDVTVVCGKPRFLDGAQDVLLSPTLIIEVLSASTKDLDRGEKFMRYRLVESLRDYVLVAQDEVHVEHFRRQTALWVLSETRDLQERLSIESIGCEIPLEEIYDRVARI
jgi:Uma2 family endonuclease